MQIIYQPSRSCPIYLIASTFLDGPNYIDLGITPSHDDCLDASLSSQWNLFCACGFMCNCLDIDNLTMIIPSTTSMTIAI